MTHQTVIFAGGGTGGHLYPGVAVARILSNCEPVITSLFVGTHRQIETEILSATEFKQLGLPVEPLSLMVRNPLRFLWQNGKAYHQAKQILKESSAHCVIGLGGMASLPMLYAAKKLSIPTVLMEQNIVFGRANRWFSQHANKIALSFAKTEGLKRVKPNVLEATGNPVRTEMSKLHHASSKQEQSTTKRLLVLGGSQGATFVNRSVREAVSQIDSFQHHQWEIVHQTGTDDVKQTENFYTQHHIKHQVAAFFQEMSSLYQSATLAISRAGATTLAELACAGCPAILIPYPDSVGDHQQKNSDYFEQHHAARIVHQEKSPTETAQHLVSVMNEFCSAPSQLDVMRQAMSKLAHPHAAEAVAKLILEKINF